MVSLFSTDDYPQSAIRNEEQGTTAVRLSIGPDGRVSGCDITASSGSSALDNATCNILRRRARFTPAKDQAGNPITDSYSQRIRWELPED
jgi:protein TonB